MKSFRHGGVFAKAAAAFARHASFAFRIRSCSAVRGSAARSSLTLMSGILSDRRPHSGTASQRPTSPIIASG